MNTPSLLSQADHNQPESPLDSLLLRAAYWHAIPMLMIANVLGLSWFKLDRECVAEALRARSDRDFKFAVDSFHYRIQDHFCKRWLRIRMSGRKLARLRR